MDFGKLFMIARPQALRPEVKFPEKYDAFNLLDFVTPDPTQSSQVPIQPGIRPKVMARYLGRVITN